MTYDVTQPDSDSDPEQQDKKIKKLVYYHRKISPKSIIAACRGQATASTVNDLMNDGIVRCDEKSVFDCYDDDNPMFSHVSQKILNITRDDALPKPTVAGLGFIISDKIGLSFSVLCVLAKIYHTMYIMYKLSKEQHIKQRIDSVMLPRETICYFFEDWPMMSPMYIGKIKHLLYKKELLLNLTERAVYCDLRKFKPFHKQLIMMSIWADQRSDMICNIILKDSQQSLDAITTTHGDKN